MPEPDDLDGMTDAELEALTNPEPPAEEAVEEKAEEQAAPDPLGLDKMADELTAAIIAEEDAKLLATDAERRARFEQAIAAEEITPFKITPPTPELVIDEHGHAAYSIPFSEIPKRAIFGTGMAPPEEVVGDLDDDEGVPEICFDRVLPDDLADMHAQLAVEENPANAPHWGAVTPFTLTLKVGRLWQPGRTLRVRFIDGNPTVVDRIRAVLASHLALVNLKFQYVDSGPAEIRVAFQPGQGSWSYVGTECLAVPADQPTMNFGWLTPTLAADRFRQVVLHEFGHALGACHEHQNPRVTIPWDREAVYRILGGPPNNWDRATVDVNFFARYSLAQVDATDFDPRSIMCYQFGPPLTTGGYSTPYNTELSAVDRAKLVSAYPRTGPQPGEDGEVDPHAPTPPAGPVLVVGGAPAQGSTQTVGHPAAFRFTVAQPGVHVISTTVIRGGNDAPIVELRTAAGALLTSRLGIVQVPLGAADYGVLVKPRANLQAPLAFSVRVRKV